MINFKNFINENKVEIFTGLGIGSVITGVIMACKNTLKVQKVLEDHNAMREAIEKEPEKKAHKSEIAKLYGYTAARFAGLYVIPAALVAGGLALCGYATKISMDKSVELAEKNAALAAVAAGAEERFDKYRDRVVEKYGAEVDEQLMCPVEEREEIVEEEDENGKKKKVKKKVQFVDPSKNLNKYRFYVTRSNPNWNDDDDLMKFIFNQVEESMNTDLNRRRPDGRPTWVTVNQLRERLAVDPKRELQCDGWCKDNFSPDNGEEVCIYAIKKQIPGADGQLEDAWQIDVNARPIYDEMF